MRQKFLIGWGLRIAALAAVTIVLANQLHWEDSLELVDGSVRSGRVERLSDGDWGLSAGTGSDTGTRIPASMVATRGAGGQAVPAVSWGLRTLGGRLAERPGVVVGVLVLFAFLLAMTGWRWRLLLRAVDLVLPLARAVRLTFIGSFFNTAIPGATGGDVVKAYYAAKATGRGTRSVLSVFVDRAIGLVGLAVFAGAVLLLAPGRAGYGPARVVVFAVLGATAIFGLVVATPLLRRSLGLSGVLRRLPFQTLLTEARVALRLYRARPAALCVALLVSLVNHGSAAFGVWLLGGALGIEGLDLGMTLALVPVANLFSAIPLLPGGWGVGELAFAYLFGQVGIAPTEAVSLSVVYRLSLLAVSLPGGLLWLVWRGRPSAETIRHEVEAAAQRVESLDVPEAGVDAPAS